MAAMDGAAAIESQGLEVRRLKASGLGNKDAPVVAAVAELQRLKALMPSSSSTEIKQDEATGDRDFAAFMEVQKHRSSCIHWLLTFAQRIELSWHFLNLMLPIERKYSRGLRDDELLASFPVTTEDAPAALPDEPDAFAGGPIGSEASAGSCHGVGEMSSMGSEASGGTCGGAGGTPSRRHTLPLFVVCDHLRSAFNVGSIFRTAECLGVRELVLCGYTATPHDAQVLRTSMGTHAVVAWSYQRRTEDAIDELRAKGILVIALETVSNAPYAHQYAFTPPPAGCALVLGNERHGVAPELLARCDAVVRLPCRGVKNSLNVAVALGMCAHEIARQWDVDGS